MHLCVREGHLFSIAQYLNDIRSMVYNVWCTHHKKGQDNHNLQVVFCKLRISKMPAENFIVPVMCTYVCTYVCVCTYVHVN